MNKALFLFTFIFAVSCSQREGDQDGETVVVNIDLNRNSENNTANFLKQLSIRLIPLESKEDAYIGMYYNQMVVSDGNIYIWDSQQAAILCFDGNGKFIRKINRSGNGPQEYITPGGIAVLNERISLLDRTRIQQYDLEGNFVKTIPVNRGHRIIVTPSGNFVISGNYTDEYSLNIYDSTGMLVSSYFPRQETLGNMILTRVNNSSMGIYENGIFVSNYFDLSVYHIVDDVVKTLYEFDFGTQNMPDDLFYGSPEDIMNKFESYKNTKLMNIDYLTVSEDWVIFLASLHRNHTIIYYNRNNDSYITNKGFELPYSILFGGINAPLGRTIKGEYYFMIESFQLREMILDLANKDKEYKSKYEFLKDIDPSGIDDNDNPWLVFYTLK
ncbi:MAG: 6-bladed beta-propeller [Bacteroidales bacterium]